MRRLAAFLRELRRRSVFRVAIVYAAVAWVLIQAASIATPALRLPAWTTTLVIVLALLGFPLALVLAWAFEVTPEGVRRAGTAVADEADESDARTSTRPGRRVVAAVVIVALVAGGWWAWRATHGAPRTGPLSRSVVAILPFSVQGSDEISYLGEGMVSLLGTKLDGAGQLRSVDSRALLSHVQRTAEGALDPDMGREIAERFGAGLYVMGDIVEIGGRVRIGAALYDAERRGEVVGEGSVEGRSADIFDLVDQLATQLLSSLSGAEGGTRVTRLAAVTTSSLPALKAYLEGESALRSGDFEAAVEAFQRAVAQDTTFALGYYRLSIAAEWLTRSDLAHEAATEAVRHAARLTPRDRNLLEAMLAFRVGDHERAEDLYRSILGAYPDDVEAWLELGEVLFHTNPLRGRSFAESREPFERVLAYEPSNVASLVHLARVAAAEGRRDEIDRLVARYAELNPEGDRLLAMRALRAFSHGTRAEQDGVTAELDRAGSLPIALAIWDVALYARNLGGAERLARMLAEPRRSIDERTVGYAFLAHMLLAQGRWREARQALDEEATINPGVALENRALLSSLWFVPVAADSLEALRRELEALDPSSIPLSGNPSVFFSAHDGAHAMLREYLLGLVTARSGDGARALQHAERLAAMPSQARGGLQPTELGTAIRAHAERFAGRTAPALEEIGRVRIHVWYEPMIASPFYSMALERFARAELLREAGRDREALAWYGNFIATSAYETIYRAPSEFGQGRIYERLGDRQRAVEHYRRFVDLWRRCDPELAPLRREAEAALARLE